MKFNLKTPLVDYEGKVVTEPADPTPGDTKQRQVDVTFRAVINAALNREVGGGPQGAEEKQKVFQISAKIWRSWKVDFTHDDCSFIKERAAINLNPLLFGRLDEFLEQKEVEMPLPLEDQDRELAEDETPKAKTAK